MTEEIQEQNQEQIQEQKETLRARLIIKYDHDGKEDEELIDMMFYNIEDIFATMYHSFKGEEVLVQDQNGTQNAIPKKSILALSLMMYPPMSNKQ